MKRIVRWAKQVSLGHQDRVKLLANVEFVEGGTIGQLEKNPQDC